MGPGQGGVNELASKAGTQERWSCHFSAKRWVTGMCPLSPATFRRTGTRVMRASLLAIGFDGILSPLHHWAPATRGSQMRELDCAYPTLAPGGCKAMGSLETQIWGLGSTV